MKRIDDLLDAATSRFRYDAGLRQEIARELRAHLEDSVAAARADGKDEVQAEESAVRAFGDPEEIGEQLWQANRRRLRRRAVFMAAVGVVLMPAGILAAVWFIPWLFAEDVGPVRAIISYLAMAAVVLYLLSRWFLPRTAVFGLAFLRWLPAAFGKSLGTAFRCVWIWAPALAFYASIMVPTQLMRGNMYASNKAGFYLQGARWWEFTRWELYQVTPLLPHSILWLLPSLGYILFAGRMGKWLRASSGLDAGLARRWHVAFIISASAGVLVGMGEVVSLQFEFLSRSRFFIVIINMIFDSVRFPIYVLTAALFLTIVFRRLRGQSLSPAVVLSSAFAIIWPMMWLLIVLLFGMDVLRLTLYIFQVVQSPSSNDFQLGYIQLICFLNLATAFLPVIIVSEQCGFRRACALFGSFVGRYLWRYVAFIFLGALLISLPRLAVGVAFGPAGVSPLVYLAGTLAGDAIEFALTLVLAVMCFEFYLTRAGTVEPSAAEAAPPLPSEESAGKTGAKQIGFYVALALVVAATCWVGFFNQPPPLEFAYRVQFGDAGQLDKNSILERTIQVVQRRLGWHGSVSRRGEDGFVVKVRPPVADPQHPDRRVTTIGALRLSLVDENPEDVNAARRGESVPGCAPFLPVRDPESGKILRDYAGCIKLWRKATYQEVKELPKEISDRDWFLVENKAQVTGEYLSAASPINWLGGTLEVAFSFRRKGRRDLEGLTEQYQPTRQHPGRLLAIILDEDLYSAPVIHSGIAASGFITGSFTQQEADEWVAILRSGQLPAPVERVPRNEPPEQRR